MSTRSSRFQEPLRLELKVSRRLRITLCGLAACALGAISCAAIPPPAQVLLAAWLLADLVLLWHRQGRAAGRLTWRGECWSWSDAAGERVLQLQQASVWPGLIVLVFGEQSGGRKRAFVLLADSFGHADMQRQLRVYLRQMPVFESRGQSGH